MTVSRFTVSLCALAITIAAAACSNPHAYDCNQACNLYKDCIDSEFDTADCETHCENESGSSAAYGVTATACYECLATPECADAGAFSCAATCTGVVPYVVDGGVSD